jgi:hypothetical protein
MSAARLPPASALGCNRNGNLRRPPSAFRASRFVQARCGLDQTRSFQDPFRRFGDDFFLLLRIPGGGVFLGFPVAVGVAPEAANAMTCERVGRGLRVIFIIIPSALCCLSAASKIPTGFKGKPIFRTGVVT